MAEIVKLFHGSYVARDVLEAGRWYHDFFGSWVYEAQYLEWEDSDNSANLMGGTFSMEMLSPRDPSKETPAARFLRRHGPHFINIAFWARDLRGLAQDLLDKGVRIALPGGGHVRELPQERLSYFVPHPKDAYGTLFEFMEDNPSFHDPRRRPWWSPSYWQDQHPLGIEELSHCTVAVAELDNAARFYQDMLGCKLVHEERNQAQKTHSMFFSVGDTLMELATPESGDSDLAKHMEAHGPILYSFNFKVKDLASAVEHIKHHRMEPRHKGSDTVELGPEDAHGGVFGFTERVIPGHPKVK